MQVAQKLDLIFIENVQKYFFFEFCLENESQKCYDTNEIKRKRFRKLVKKCGVRITMKKKTVWIAAAGAVILSLTGCGGKASESSDSVQDTQIIRVAFNQSEEHPEYLAMKEFGEKFEEETDGRYKVEIYPNAILGDQGPVTEFVRTGALQMAMVPCSVPEGYNEDFAIIGAPYLYDSVDQLRKVTLNGTFDELFASTQKYNFEVVAVYTSGMRNIYASKPIETPEDMKGLKVRVMDSDTYIQMTKLMGGVGVPMAQGDVYTGIQQKVIDGAENSERVYVDFKHYEVAKYYSYTQHVVMPDVVIANAEFLQDMSAEDREVYDRLMKESVEKEFDLFEESVEEAKQDAEEAGVTFVYPDTEIFQERCQPILDELADRSDVTRRIYDAVQKVKEEEKENESSEEGR